MSTPRRSIYHRKVLGFSLIELMIGVVVGMISLLAIYKVLAVWNNSSRTTVVGGDSQVAGTLAMFTLERDIKEAGLGIGMAPPPVMGCPVTGTDTIGGALAFSMYPVQITVGAGGTPDTITVLSGNSSFFVTAEPFTASTATSKKLTRRTGFRRGDVAIVSFNPSAAPASATCEVVQITDNTNFDTFTVDHVAGTFVPDPLYAGASTTSRYNAVGGSNPAISTGSMFNLGPAPQLDQWTIAGRVLRRADLMKADEPAVDISEGVINMKAQYGVDANADNIIQDSEWTTTTPTDWTQVRAIRIAILVRSSQYEKLPTEGASTSPAVTPVAPAPSFADSTTFFKMTNVNGGTDTFDAVTPDPNNWRFYRYRVYEKVIPLRNMIWGTAPTW